MKKMLSVVLIVIMATSCANYQLKNDVAKQECDNRLQAKEFKSYSEMLEKCYHPKEVQIYKERVNKEKIAAILVGAPVSDQLDLLMAKQAKELEFAKNVEKHKITKEEANTQLAEYIVQLNGLELQRNAEATKLNLQRQSLGLQAQQAQQAQQQFRLPQRNKMISCNSNSMGGGMVNTTCNQY